MARGRDALIRPQQTQAADEVVSYRIRMSFENAHNIEPVGEDRMEGYLNLFYGRDPSAWTTGIEMYNEVVYEGLYDGIDLRYLNDRDGLKYEFIVEPFANPGCLRIKVDGNEGLFVDDDGALVISTALGDLVDARPVAYYQDEPSHGIGCSYLVLDGRHFGFALERYDHQRPVVIDPLVMSSYLGGADDEQAYGTVTDDDGNIYVTGITRSVDFPNATGYCGTFKGLRDRFVCKYDITKGTLEYATFIGGSDSDEGAGIALDGDGNVLIGGHTRSNDFPATPGAFCETHSPGTNLDGFVSMFSADGRQLMYSTFLGGPSDESIWDVDVTSEGIAYVCGVSASEDLGNGHTGYSTSFNGGGGDGFIASFEADGRGVMNFTSLGGTDYDMCRGIELDGDGKVHVVGLTNSLDFSLTEGAIQQEHGGSYSDAFVSKFDASLSRLIYSTYLGANGYDIAEGVAVGPDGSMYATGLTESEDFPITGGAFQRTHGGGTDDAFITRISQDGSALLYSTYLGGGQDDHSRAIDVDEHGFAYVAGMTYSSDFPTTLGVPGPGPGSLGDGFLCRLSLDGSELAYSTVFGGSGSDSLTSVVAVGGGHAVMSGITNSTDLETVNTSLQSSLNGPRDAFICKFSTDVEAPVAEAGPHRVVEQHTVLRFDGSGSSDDIGILNWTWTFCYGGREITLAGPMSEFTFDVPGSYLMTLRVEDAAGNWANDTMNVTVLDTERPFADAGPDIIVNQHETVRFNGSGSVDLVGIVDFNWSFVHNGSEVTLRGKTPTYVFDVAGIFTVFMNVTDAAGNWATDTVCIIVNDITLPVAEAGPDQTVDEWTWGIFNGSASSDNVGIVNYTWTFVNGVPVVLHGVRPTYGFHEAQTFVVMLNVTDAAGNWAVDSMTVTVNDISPPVAEAGPGRVVDEGTLVTFDGSGSSDDMGVVNYTWSFRYGADDHLLYGVSPSFTFDAPGVYSIGLDVFDAAGNRGGDFMVLTVSDITPPKADAGPDQRVSVGSSVPLNGSLSSDNVAIKGYSWTFTYSGRAMTLDGEAVQFSFKTGDVYQVVLTVTDAAGNVDNDTVTITVVNTGKVIGTVLDEIGRPVGGADVEIRASDGKAYTTSTAANGSFALDVHYGVFTWKISKDGYREISGSSLVGPMNTTELDLSDLPLVREDKGGLASSSLMILAVIVILVVIAVALVLMKKRTGGPVDK